MPCREGKLSGGAFFIALDINHWFSGSILILLGITIGGLSGCWRRGRWLCGEGIGSGEEI